MDRIFRIKGVDSKTDKTLDFILSILNIPVKFSLSRF
jgi:hypothetical protein